MFHSTKSRKYVFLRKIALKNVLFKCQDLYHLIHLKIIIILIISSLSLIFKTLPPIRKIIKYEFISQTRQISLNVKLLNL